MRLNSFSLALAFLMPLVLTPISSLSQTTASPAAPAPTSTAKRATKKNPNVQAGTITALDLTAETITIRDRANKDTTYSLTEKTHYLKGKRIVQASAFAVKDSVVVHLRKSRKTDSQLVTELTDAVSWDWLTEMRHKIVQVTLKEISEESVETIVGPDAIPLAYTVSEKTRWSKGGKETAATDFKPGDKVYVVPRSLPSGTIMARAISDTLQGADQLKERTATSVHGTITAIENDAHKLTLATVAGDTRTIPFTTETEVRQTGKLLALTSLKAGQHVSVRVHRSDAGTESATRITIESAKRLASTRARKR